MRPASRLAAFFSPVDATYSSCSRRRLSSWRLHARHWRRWWRPSSAPSHGRHGRRGRWCGHGVGCTLAGVGVSCSFCGQIGCFYAILQPVRVCRRAVGVVWEDWARPWNLRLQSPPSVTSQPRIASSLPEGRRNRKSATPPPCRPAACQCACRRGQCANCATLSHSSLHTAARSPLHQLSRHPRFGAHPRGDMLRHGRLYEGLRLHQQEHLGSPSMRLTRVRRCRTGLLC